MQFDTHAQFYYKIDQIVKKIEIVFFVISIIYLGIYFDYIEMVSRYEINGYLKF